MLSGHSAFRAFAPVKRAALCSGFVAFLAAGLTAAPASPQVPAAGGWTLDDAFRQLTLSPRDPYLQYVVMQLARRAGRTTDYGSQIDELLRRNTWRGTGRRVDLFDLFTGALAVQESLQLDTMRDQPLIPDWSGDVEVASLVGPTVTSHPWSELLAGRVPAVSTLSCLVPEDYFLVEFGSVTKMLDVLESGDLWAVHLLQQVAHDATSLDVADRLRTQLAVETHPILRPLYDELVGQIAICGSDLYVREGTDVTLLFELKQPELFRARMLQFLDNAQKAHPDAVREEGQILGVPYVHVTTRDRTVHVFAADPSGDVHVRSNSKAALERVLAAIAGKDRDGQPVRRLGETDEFRYIRCLFPRDSADEDGFVYLSDPLIRRIVGPRVKLTEQRRLVCYNHLRMIGHAALLYRTERGAVPSSLAAIEEARCTPGSFATGQLACPQGGAYSLDDDGLSGICSCHGRALSLTPCLEVPVTHVGRAEAEAYGEFLQEYERYWRRYFDPIAIRVRADDDRYRLETIVLPLIENSIYTGLAAALGGEPEPLDALPVPASSIFTFTLKFDEKMAGAGLGGMLGELVPRGEGGLSPADLEQFLVDGLGHQIAMHACDAPQMFDFSLPQFLGDLLGDMRGGSMSSELSWISFLVASLNAPVYLAVPVRDAAIVDGFLEKLDGALAVLARRPTQSFFWDIQNDFCRLPDEQGHAIRSASIGFGPIKWRMFWARIGDGLYVASKQSVLRELMGAKPPEDSPSGHAMVRIRPKNWATVLEDYQLGWAENARLACLDNLGPLTGVAKSLGEVSATGAKRRDAVLLGKAHAIHGASFYCPDGGSYRVTDEDGDERRVSCSVHGSLREPRQPAGLTRENELSGLLARFSGLTATLTFLPEGLRAVLEIERGR